MATAVHSWMPELTHAVGASRVVGIGYPGSVPFGAPGDPDGQRAVLQASLEAAAAMTAPGRIDLPFEWPRDVRIPRPPEPPPIARAIVRRPWLYLKLLQGDLPAPEPGADDRPSASPPA